jgi:hypothetical protein
MPQDSKLVWEFIHGCSICQQNKIEHLHPASLLQPLAVPNTVWADIVMDFINGFPKVGGKLVILMVVDHFSMYGHFIALSHPYSTVMVAASFFEHVVRLHGIPASIVSDQDPIFMSRVWQELCHLSSTKLCLSSAFRPQMDGQSEVTNRVITMYLRCLASDRP